MLRRAASPRFPLCATSRAARPSGPLASRVLPLALFALAACGGGDAAPAADGRSGGPGGGRGPGGRPQQPTAVEIAILEPATLALTSEVTARLEPRIAVGVNAQVGGALTRVLVEEGDRVREGQVLAEVDSRDLQAQLKAAEAQLAFAKSTAERSQTLFRQQIVTAAEYERDEAALAAAEATLAQLRTRIGFTRIVAPINGVVTRRLANTGDVVSGNQRVFDLADLSTLVAILPVSELEVTQVAVGDAVPLRVDALGDRRFEGRIRRIFPTADSTTRLVPVEVAIDGDALRELKPGFTVRARLQLGSKGDVLVVPTRALLGAAGAQSVFVVSGEIAERRAVRVGPDVDGVSEVFGGLAVGDSVVVAGAAFLRAGESVRIVDPLTTEIPATSRPTGDSTTAILAPAAGARSAE